MWIGAAGRALTRQRLRNSDLARRRLRLGVGVHLADAPHDRLARLAHELDTQDLDRVASAERGVPAQRRDHRFGRRPGTAVGPLVDLEQADVERRAHGRLTDEDVHVRGVASRKRTRR